MAFLKTAQKFDSYLASMGLNVAQTGSSMGMEILMAARILGGAGGGGSKSVGSFFRGGAAAAGGASGAAGGFMSGFASKFKGNSYVRDAVVDGGSKMGAGGGIGFVGRTFGGMAARNGATLTGESISSVASRSPAVSGNIAGDIADRSLGNYMPQLSGTQLSGTQITGGQISTTAIGSDGKESALSLYSASQFEAPDMPHSTVTASDGSQWYQTATGEGMGAFYSTPEFTGDVSEAAQVAATFPGAADGTTLRSVDEGVIEANSPDGGNSMWYNSAYYDEPNAPHDMVSTADGVGWYAMQPHAESPHFEGADGGTSLSDSAAQYNQAQFSQYMPGYDQSVMQVDASHADTGTLEVRHADGSGTQFYDKTMYQSPRGDYQVYEDAKGGQWYAVQGTPAVDHRPVYDNSGKPVYDDNGKLKTMNVESIRYKSTPTRFSEPDKRDPNAGKTPRKK